jgi:simple sugar transport system permease protein
MGWAGMRKKFAANQLSVGRRTSLFFGLFLLIGVLCCYASIPVITISVLASAVRQSTPLVLGALCGLLCERSGVMNIGIEGQMLVAAFTGFLVNVWTGSLAMAVLTGLAAGAFSGFLLAFMSVTLKIDQIIGGTVINIMAFGLTGYFYQVGMSAVGKLKIFKIPLLSEIPLIGPVLFTITPIALSAILFVFVFHYLLFYTRWGLRTRATGEHPKAADTMGVNVFLVRYTRVIIGGGLAGLAGTFLSLEAVGAFERGMTNGRGFIALAILIFGKWTPLGAWGAALLFGLSTAVQTQLQFGGKMNIPHQFTGMLPYLITIAVLAFFVRRNRPPAAIGIPYEKE